MNFFIYSVLHIFGSCVVFNVESGSKESFKERGIKMVSSKALNFVVGILRCDKFLCLSSSVLYSY